MDKFRLAKIRKISEKCLKPCKEAKKERFTTFKTRNYAKWLTSASLAIVTGFTLTFAAISYFTPKNTLLFPPRTLSFTQHISPYTPPIKHQLFTKNTHESDQLIASISNELIEKEFTNKQKTEKLIALEQERLAANKKILWMETSIDALSKTLLVQTASQENQLKQYQKLEQKFQSQKESLVKTTSISKMHLQSLVRSLDQLSYISTFYKSQLTINIGLMHALQTEHLIAQKQQIEQKEASLALYSAFEQYLSLANILGKQLVIQEKALKTALEEAKQDNEEIFLFGQQLQETLSLQETLLEESENRANKLKITINHKENDIQENQQLIESQREMIKTLQRQLTAYNEQKLFPYHFQLYQAQKSPDTPAINKTDAMEELVSLQNALTRKQKALVEERSLEQKAKKHFDQQIAEAAERIDHLQKENTSLQNQLKIEHYRFIAAQKAASLKNLKDQDVDPPKTATLNEEINEDTAVMISNEPEECTTHIVQNGESLSSISLLYFGTPVFWEEIYQLNRYKIPNRNDLVKNIELKIPTNRE